MNTHDEIRTLADQLLRDLEQARIDSDARLKALNEQCDRLLAVIDAAKAGVKALDAREDGWIPWAGGACPVDRDIIVTVRYRDAGTERTHAGRFMWWHDGKEWDIVAYRLEG